MASPDCHRPRLSRGRLLLPRLFRLRAELLAPALPAAGRPGRVPRVAVHADHLEEEPLLRLREPRHRRGGWALPFPTPPDPPPPPGGAPLWWCSAKVVYS